jgi:hypothetical protein
VRASDPVEIPTAAGVLILALPQDPHMSDIARPDPQGLVGRLRLSRQALQDPIIAGQVRRLVARACVYIPTGLPTTDALIAAVGVGLTQRTIIGIFLPRAPLGTATTATGPKPAATPSAAFASMSAEQRIGLLLERTPKELAPDVARAFRSMVTVEALAGIAAAFVVLLAAQFVGVGEIADAALAWWAYCQAGFAGVTGLYEALRAVVTCVRTTDERVFDQAVKHFAEGLTLVGVAFLTVVLTRAARKRAGGAEGGGSADSEPIVWPPNRGFAGDPVAKPLPVGTRIDRYGYEGGTFVSPEGTPVEARSLAPGTTSKPYNVYEVDKPITVDSGTAAPWFGQPGGGTQYELPMSVGDAVDQGYLKKVGP